ncbi:MAG TPA: hypothetical protein PKM44_00445 [Turneriella sp.]|nr:hypothetical protein [Turneriella sp.]HNL08947.1 hypothetical protein [Turneriella sp.]
MIWQKLKNSSMDLVAALASRINTVVAFLAKPLNLFRFIVILLALDFVAFMSLTRSSYLQLVNPLHFLWAEPGESRKSIELYFPRSLSLTGLEKIYPDEDTSQGKKTVAEQSAQEKPLDDAAVAQEALLTRKLVSEPVTKFGELQLSKEEALARRVILELIAGPAGELETLKARNLLKEPLFLRSLWTREGTLYISTEKSLWDRMSPNERKVTEFCIRESLKKNLGETRFALLKE